MGSVLAGLDGEAPVGSFYWIWRPETYWDDLWRNVNRWIGSGQISRDSWGWLRAPAVAIAAVRVTTACKGHGGLINLSGCFVHMGMVPKVDDLISFFMSAVARSRPPGKLERQKHYEEDDQIPAHEKIVAEQTF